MIKAHKANLQDGKPKIVFPMLDFLIVVFIVLGAVDFFASRQFVERIRTELLNYWVFVEELPFKTELSTHVTKVRLFLKNNVRLLALILGLMLLSAAVFELIHSSNEMLRDRSSFIKTRFTDGVGYLLIKSRTEEKISEAIQNTFPELELGLSELTPLDIDLNNAYGAKIPECERELPDTRCQGLSEHLMGLKAEQKRLLDNIATILNDDASQFATKLIAVNFAILLINAVIYFLSFLISVTVTLRLLKSMEHIRLTSIMFCLVDLTLAVLIPIFAITLLATAVSLIVSLDYERLIGGSSGSTFGLVFGSIVFPLQIRSADDV